MILTVVKIQQKILMTTMIQYLTSLIIARKEKLVGYLLQRTITILMVVETLLKTSMMMMMAFLMLMT